MSDAASNESSVKDSELIKYFFKVTAWLNGIFAALLTTFGVFKPEVLVRFGYLGFITTLLILLYVSMFMTIIKMTKVARTIYANPETDLPELLVKGLNHWHKEKRFTDIVRLGSEISRALWLSGNYKERVEIGKLVEDAAGKTGSYKQQITALIDDVGWTLAVMGKLPSAEENISSGVEKADHHQFYYWAAKGERHLAGISSRKGDKPTIFGHLKSAMDYANKINNVEEKAEMIASLELARGEYLLEMGNPNDALVAVTSAKSSYASMKEQSDREVKVYSRLGNIYLALGDIKQAKDQFNEGYKKSQGIRDDEVARNLLGLARVYISKPDFAQAKESLSDAKVIFDRLGMIEESKTAQELLDGLEPH